MNSQSKIERISRALFHLVPVAVFSVIFGWAFNVSEYYGWSPFLLVFLVTPWLIPGLRKRYGLWVPTLTGLFFLLGFLYPIWRPDPGPMPSFGPEIAPLTVNGFNPKTFLSKGTAALLPQQESQETLELRGLLYKLSFGTVRMALSEDDRVEDFRLRITGDMGLAIPWEERDTRLTEGDLVGRSLLEAQERLGKLAVDPLPEPVSGEAFIILGSQKPNVVIYRDKELVVFGNSIYQNTSLMGQVNDVVGVSLRKRLDFSYTNSSVADLYFRDNSFQKSRDEVGKVFLKLEQEKIAKLWAVYPLRVWVGDEDYLEPFQTGL